MYVQDMMIGYCMYHPGAARIQFHVDTTWLWNDVEGGWPNVVSMASSMLICSRRRRLHSS